VNREESVKLSNLSGIHIVVLFAVSALPGLVRAQSAPSDLEQHLAKAGTYIRENQPQLAIPELAKAVQIDPDNINAQANLGVLLFFQNRPSEAIPHLRAAVEKQAGLTKIQGILGIAEAHTGDVNRAREDLSAVFPQIGDIPFKLQVGLELVSLETASGDLPQAAQVLTELQKVAPKNPEVLYASYRTYSDQATSSMISLALTAPESAQVHQLMAHELLRRGDTNGAIQQFRKAIALDPNLPGIHYELAEVLHTSEASAAQAEAESEYHAALTQNPNDEKTLLELGRMTAQRGDTQQARSYFERSIQVQPDNAEAKVELSKLLLDEKDAARVKKLLEEAVAEDPSNMVAHYRLATIYRKAGRMEDAHREVEVYKKLRDTHDNLDKIYRELLLQPQEIDPTLPGSSTAK